MLGPRTAGRPRNASMVRPAVSMKDLDWGRIGGGGGGGGVAGGAGCKIT